MDLRLALLLLTLLFTPACFLSKANINEPLDPGAVQALVPGQSTADDVLDVLGAPADVVQIGRRTAWRYDRTQVKDTGLFLLVVVFRNVDTKQDRIWVFFDADGLLTHMGGTFEADDVKYELPF